MKVILGLDSNDMFFQMSVSCVLFSCPVLHSLYFKQHSLQDTGGCPSLPFHYCSDHSLTKADFPSMSGLHMYFKSFFCVLICIFPPGTFLSFAVCVVF